MSKESVFAIIPNIITLGADNFQNPTLTVDVRDLDKAKQFFKAMQGLEKNLEEEFKHPYPEVTLEDLISLSGRLLRAPLYDCISAFTRTYIEDTAPSPVKYRFRIEDKNAPNIIHPTPYKYGKLIAKYSSGRECEFFCSEQNGVQVLTTPNETIRATLILAMKREHIPDLPSYL